MRKNVLLLLLIFALQGCTSKSGKFDLGNFSNTEAQQPVTVGTSSAPASLDTNFGNTQSNFDELYGKVPVSATLVGTTLTITLEDATSFGVDLSGLQDGIGTDDQVITDLSLSGNVISLTLENGGTETVDLSGILGAGGLADAPSDGTMYARQDGSWVEVSTGTDDQNASEVPFTPNGSISATTVQLAIQEVRDEAGSGSMVYPGVGIPLSTGSAWGTSYSLATLAAGLDDEAWTFTGAVDMSGASSVSLGTLVFADTATLPSEVGELRYVNNATGFVDGLFAWYDDDSVRYIVDLDTLPTVDDYVVAYDATNGEFYMKQDDSSAGGTDDQNASEVPFTPNGSISATTVQDAIVEVRDEAGGGSSSYDGADIPYRDTAGTAGDYRVAPDGTVYIYVTDHWETLATATDGLSNTPSVSLVCTPDPWDAPGGVTTDADATQTITCTATNGAVTFTSFGLATGTYYADAGTGTCTQTESLAQDASCTIDLIFQYDAAGAVAASPISDTLTVNSNVTAETVTLGPTTVTDPVAGGECTAPLIHYDPFESLTADISTVTPAGCGEDLTPTDGDASGSALETVSFVDGSASWEPDGTYSRKIFDTQYNLAHQGKIEVCMNIGAGDAAAGDTLFLQTTTNDSAILKFGTVTAGSALLQLSINGSNQVSSTATVDEGSWQCVRVEWDDATDGNDTYFQVCDDVDFTTNCSSDEYDKDWPDSQDAATGGTYTFSWGSSGGTTFDGFVDAGRVYNASRY